MVEKVISNDYDISETFNKLFENIVPNLKIIPSQNFETSIQYETENLVKKHHTQIQKSSQYQNDNI